MKKLISLGYNCEVSFQIEKFKGAIDSSLFSWAYLLDDTKFLQALENVDDIFMNGIHFHMTTDDMFYDEKYDITFHGRTPKNVMFDEDGNIKDQVAYDECIAELKSRLAHLKEKFKKDFMSEDEKIYLRKIEIVPEQDGNVNWGRVIDFINNLKAFFEKRVSQGGYKLIIIIERKFMTPELKAMEDDKLYLRTVDWLAPFYDTKNGADDESWRRILEEFSADE